MIKLIAGDFTLDAAQGDQPRRSISGTAVPYNVPAIVSDGTAVIFRPGSLPVTGKAPRLFMYHDASQPVGVVTERVDTEQGMMFTAKISATTLGNDALVMASDGTIDQVSVGVNPTKFSYDDEGTMVIEEASWMELSLVPIGAFGDMANIATVAASIHQEPEEISTIETEVQEQEQHMSEVTAPAVEATIPTAPIFAQAKKQLVLPSAGEYMAAYHIGGETFANINKAVAEISASQRTPLQAAAGDVITTDTPGLLPIPVLGPLVQDLNFLRPVIEAVGARAYPDGGRSKTFIRPTITTHTSVATQSTELSAVSATTMVIASNSVSKTTLAGQVSLSSQDISFTSPEAMGLILNDLMGEAMIASDNLAADNLLAAATSSGVWDGTPEDLLKSVYDAANDVASGRNWMPTHMFVSVDVWAQLGQLVDSSKRPLFPFIGAGLTGQNALGASSAGSWNGTPMGLQLVVDSNFAAKTMIITRVGQGQGDAYEYYESIQGLLSVDTPSTLGKTISYHLYASTFAAIPGMIRKITQA